MPISTPLLTSSRHIKNFLCMLSICFLLACNSEKQPTLQPVNEVSSGEADPVIQGISQLIERSSLSHELLQKRGELLYQRERYAEAEEDLKKAIEIKDDQPSYYHLLADIQLDGARSREAVKTMKGAVERFPTRIPSYLKLSEFYLILKQHDESLGTINEIIRLDPQNADAYFLLGMNFREMGDIDKALNSLQRSVELDADMIDAWILLGNIYEKKKEPIAEKYYQNAVDSDTQNLEALHSLADYYRNVDRISESIEAYNQILNINPKYTDAHLNAGILNLSIDSLDRALMHFNLLVAMEPTDTKAREYRDLAQEMINESK